MALGAGAFALYRFDPWADRGHAPPPGFAVDLKDQLAIDPALVQFSQTREIIVSSAAVHAVAVGPNDDIYVAGDEAVHVFPADGAPSSEIIRPKGRPTCLAVGDTEHIMPGRIYVGTGKVIEVFSPSGEPLAVWPGPSDKTVLTSIAIAESDIYAADAGERVVVRFNQRGELVGQIGRADPDREMPGFVVPSPYFDVAIGPAGELVAVNPGALRVQMYTPDGELDSFWGKAGSGIEDFFGCCNPAHLAMLPDGRFVTSEKGVPRIKIYSSLGEFECVVAGAKELGVSDSAAGDARAGKDLQIFDVATDSRGRVLVLDPAGKRVRVFTPDAG